MQKKAVDTRLKITEGALVQRINRKLKKNGELMRIARGQQVEQMFGRYFIANAERKTIVTHHVDLKSLARELNVVQPWEELESRAADWRPLADATKAILKKEE